MDLIDEKAILEFISVVKPRGTIEYSFTLTTYLPSLLESKEKISWMMHVVNRPIMHAIGI